MATSHPSTLSTPASLATAHALILRGRQAVLSAQPMLVELAGLFSQPGAADYLEYFLTQPYTGGKIPHLVLLTTAPRESFAEVTLSEVLGAVLLHEYQFARVPLKVFVTEDRAGERNVFAPASTRAAIAVHTVEHLLRRGAHLVALSLKDASFDRTTLSPRADSDLLACSWSSAQRTLTRRLPLGTSYDATLATLGAHTRRNLRYYRRRVERQLQCIFVPRAQISEEEFIALNRVCSYPTPDFVSRWRYRTAQTVPGGVFAGIRTAAGDWLSIVAGRRSHRTTSIDWQINQRLFLASSLSTVMRSYLIEHEIAEGSRTLLFEGGTPHSMQLSFSPDWVGDFVGMRQTLPAQFLRRYAATVLPANNFLAQMLSRTDLVWKTW